VDCSDDNVDGCINDNSVEHCSPDPDTILKPICGVLLPAEHVACDFRFRADEKVGNLGQVFALDNYGDFVVGCRVQVTGSTQFVCPPSCGFGDLCPNIDGCIHNDTIEACDLSCEQSRIEILAIEVQADTDPGIGNGFPDVFVEFYLHSSTCEELYYDSTDVEKNSPPKSMPHEGYFTFSPDDPDTKPDELRYRVLDDDGCCNPVDLMIGGPVGPATIGCENCASGDGPDAKATVCLMHPIDESVLGSSTIGRTLPASASTNELIQISLTLGVDQLVPSSLTLSELIPDGYVFVGAIPPPDSMEPVADGDESFGTRLIWEFPKPLNGVDIPIQYEAITPNDPALIAQAFRSMIVEAGAVHGNLLVLSDVVIGGVLNDCNSNGMEDVLEIFNGTAGDRDGDLIPDECSCPWDCGDGDGVVGIVDFLALLAEWNLVDTPCDFDGAGVGIVDFLKLLAAWGPCP
jgi:hypothetical protein